MGKSNYSRSLLMTVSFIFLVSLISSPAWGAAAGKEKYGGVLRIGVPKDPMSIDARYAGGSVTDMWGPHQMYDRLGQWKEKVMTKTTPGLAVKWEKKDDLTWIVQLRKGVKYHNGKELTAQDVALNFDWKINSRKYLKEKGYKPPRVRSTTVAMKSVEALDRYTLKFNLLYPFAPFENIGVGWGLQFGPIDPDVVEKYGRSTAMHPVGTGPFKFVEYVPADHITMERFDGYWGGKPHVDKVIVRIIPDDLTRALALEKGEIDIAASLSLQSVMNLKKNPAVTVHLLPSASKTYGVLWFNFRRWPMNQLKFRQAVAMGADWENLVKVSFPKGTASIRHSLLKGSFAENPEAEKWFPKFNPVKARELLKEVEKEAGKPIPPVYFLSRSGGGGIDKNVAQFGAEQLKKIGLKVNLNILEYEVAKDKMKRDPQSEWDLGLTSVKGAGMDPMQAAEDFSSKNPATFDDTNREGYKNPKVDNLIEEGVRAYDLKKRTKIYQDMERIVLKDDLAALILYNTPIVYGVRTRVHDFKPHDSAFLYIFTPWNNMWIEKGK
jgi:peptide/nickel transport system substrate-binding protein